MSNSNGKHDHRFGDSGEPDPRRQSNGQHGSNGREHTPGENGSAGKAGDPPAPGASNRRNLSEISHLFLSDLRQLNGSGRTPPSRKPPAAPPAEDEAPPRTAQTIDLTPDELEAGAAPDADEVRVPPVSAVLGARLNGTLIRRACQYASGLVCEQGIGLVIVESNELRLMWVAPGHNVEEIEGGPEMVSDAETLRAALLEMSCDIERWLVVIPDPRLPHARRLLAGLEEWVLLATADHEGVVASYRTLKGLCDVEITRTGQPPRVTLALVDAESATDAQRHARKLMGVCRQFLDLRLTPAEAIDATPGAVSHVESYTARELICCSWEHATDAAGAWRVLEQVLLADPADQGNPTPFNDSGDISMFYDSRKPEIPDELIPPMARPVPRPARATASPEGEAAAPSDAEVVRRREPAPPPAAMPSADENLRRLVDQIEIPDLARPSLDAQATPAPAVAPAHAGRGAGEAEEAAEQVIDLPAGETVADVILSRLGVAVTPVTPPMLPTGKLCVTREGALMLIASAAPGLTDLPTIGRAMTWATENRALLGMALSQYRLSESEVLLHLLISRADAGAGALQPLLSTGRVTVQAYRRLNWGGRAGFLLEAA